MGRLDLRDPQRDEDIRWERVNQIRASIEEQGIDATATEILKTWLPVPDELKDERMKPLPGRAMKQSSRITRGVIALFWLSHGHGEKEIAEHMVCSRNTVKEYLSRQRLKMGMAGCTREQLVAEAIRSGLIP